MTCNICKDRMARALIPNGFVCEPCKLWYYATSDPKSFRADMARHDLKNAGWDVGESGPIPHVDASHA